MINPVAFHIGPFAVRWYAVFILSGILVALVLSIREAKRFGISKDFIIDLVTFGVPIAIIGARLYYVFFNLDYYLQNPIEIIKINEGGIAIHGAIIAAFIWGYFFAKRHKVNFVRLADIGAMGFIIAQAIGRWGNFFNQEAYGGVVSLNFLEKLHLPQFIIDGMFINGQYHHPTFLYESIWNLVGFIILLFVRRQKWVKTGDIALIYFVYYSIGRFFTEWLRTMGDPHDALRIFGLPIAQMISVFFIVAGVSLLILKRKFNVFNEKYNVEVTDEN